MVAEEEVVVPGVERGGNEQARDSEISHVLEAAVGGDDVPAHDPETQARHLLAEQVILGVQSAFVKAAQFIEARSVEQHEHAGGERPAEPRELLRQVAGGVEDAVEAQSLRTMVVGGDAVEPPAPHQFDGAAQQRGIVELDVGVDE